MILKVCEESDHIDGKIEKKVRDINIKRNAEDYLRLMKPIAVALDKVQSDSCKLSEAVEVWKALERETDSLQPFDVAQKVQLRSKQVLTPAHYLSNIIDRGTWVEICHITRLIQD